MLGETKNLGLRALIRSSGLEGKPLTDRSTLGVYFSKDGTAQELLTFALASVAAVAAVLIASPELRDLVSQVVERLRSLVGLE